MQKTIPLMPMPTVHYNLAKDEFTGSLFAHASHSIECQEAALLEQLRMLPKELKKLKKKEPCCIGFTENDGSELLIAVTFDRTGNTCQFSVMDHRIPQKTGNCSTCADQASSRCPDPNPEQVNQLQEGFYKILGSLYDDFTIIDSSGVIEKALPNFQTMYGISPEEVQGCTIFDMEERKIFNPCVSARVFKSKKTETMMQQTSNGKYLMCTSIPVFSEDGQLYKIVSYTRDVTKYEQLKEEYDNLQSTVASYSAELEQLRLEREKNVQIIGESAEMRRISQTAVRIAKFDATVLLTGESGVGKSMFADIIHRSSKRASGPFIAINCGAIPENLLESELFGYEKGAFTGAGREGKPGLVELADGGTLFLDEIGDLPMHMQVKLLKMIQDKKVTRVGGVDERTIDFRLIAATNKEIETLIEQKLFREDLYYRLNVISLVIPPLRDRRDDIFHLITHFTNKFNQQYGISHAFSSKAIDYLESYRWPGNIRELENVVERTLLTTEEYTITEENLPYSIYSGNAEQNMVPGEQTLKQILESVEKQVILNCYKQYHTTTKMADALGISQSSASVKLAKYLIK